jgi:hypothetical protein
MNEVQTLVDRSRAVEAPSISPGRSLPTNEAQLAGLPDRGMRAVLRPLFQVLVHPWAIALANATIALILAFGFAEMVRSGLEPLHTAQEVVTGLGVILIGWGVALEERHKLREVFGLLGGNEAREEAIDETCHRFGLGQLLFGLFAEIMVEAVRIPDAIINTGGIEKPVLIAASVLLGIGGLLLIKQIVMLVRA